METPKVHQQINALPTVFEATDFSAQLVAIKALFMSEIYELKRKINRLRENINKRETIRCISNTKIKNYYLGELNCFLKQKLTLKQNAMDKLLEVSSSPCKKRYQLRIQKFRRPSKKLKPYCSAA